MKSTPSFGPSHQNSKQEERYKAAHQVDNLKGCFMVRVLMEVCLLHSGM